MRKISNVHVKFAATLFCLVQTGMVAAEERWISGGLGASQLWDSNFYRDPEAVSEQITLLTAGIGLAANVSRQQFSARLRVRSYQHEVNDQFDETLRDGLVRWNGAWAGDFTTNVEWVRDAYLVDRWEAVENDVVSKDDAKFTITRGNGNRLSFQVGGRQTKQTHSSDIRDDLNYDEDEGFVGMTYKTPANSTLTLRYRSGDRTYVNRAVEDPSSDFDFDYQQAELENVWKISDKTSSTITFSRFKRKGALNDSTGDYALWDLSWDATPKVQWHAGYTYKQPALGETIDMPSRIQTGFVGFSWDITSKLGISSRAEKVWRNYNNPGEEFVRNESQVNLIPLALSYTFNESLTIKLDTSWRKNDSPKYDRQYEASQAVLGLAFRF